MEPNLIKSIFIELSNFIDNKLKTPTGKLTLVIINCLILGGAVMYSFNISGNLTDVVRKEYKERKRADSTQTVLNTYIQTESQRCSETLEKGALFQQKMKVIYSEKEEENYKIAKENERILKQREAIAKAKLENIKALTNLNNQKNE